MDFNFTTETITPDKTQTNGDLMITIGGTQGVQLPSGNLSQRPPSPAAGTLRFTTANNTLEYWNGSAWYSIVGAGTDVTSFQTSLSGLTPTTATTGAVTLAGTLGVTSGGTGLSAGPTANGQLLIGSSSGAYTLATLTGGTGVTVTNTGTSITLSLTSGAYVSSFSAGLTGLTPSTATTGAVTLAGTLGVGYGGTGLTSTPTNGQIDIGNSTGFTRTTLTAGGGITVTNGAGTITITSTDASVGTVPVVSTSVSQSTGVVLSYTYNILVAPSSGGTGSAVTLPSNPYVGQKVFIENRSGVGLNYYPANGAAIENLGTNNPYSNTNNGNTSFVALSATQWYAYVSSYTNGVGISITPSTTQGNQYIFANSGVLSIIGTANQITASAATGNVTLSLPTTLVVTNVTASGQVLLSEAVVAAAGTNQGTATVLTATHNVVTSGTGGVSLPVPSGGGLLVTVLNRSGATITIYPNSGGALEGFGTNAGITLSNNANVEIVSISATQYYLIDAPTIAGTNLVATFANGVETLSLSTTPSVTNLTVSGLTTNSFVYSGTGGAITSTAAPTNGQLLIGSTGAAPQLGSIAGGTGITVTNGAGTISIANAGVVSDQGTANQIQVNGTTTAQTGANVFTIAPNVILPGNASETIPNGTTAQRPATPTVAMMRYNTTEDIIEGYAEIGTGYANVGANTVLDNIAIPKSLNYRKRRYWYDEFMFGSAPSTNGNVGVFGDLGWGNVSGVSNSATNNTGTNSIITGSTDHPGILSLGTAAVSGGYMCLYPNVPASGTNATTGMIALAQIEYVSFLIRIPTLTNVNTINIGLIDNGNTGPTNTYVNAVFFQYYLAFTQWLSVTYNAGTEAYTPTNNVTVVANTWCFLELWNTGTSWVFAVNGTVIQNQTTNLPTSAIVQPCIQLVNNTAATSTTLQIDAFSMITKELGNRY